MDIEKMDFDEILKYLNSDQYMQNLLTEYLKRYMERQNLIADD